MVLSKISNKVLPQVPHRIHVHTNFLQVLIKPPDANNDNQDVDEAKIGKDGDKVDIQLLIQLQIFDIDSIA